MNVYVFVEVHSHFDDAGETNEAHTTIQVEFYGYDSEGYNYSIELSESEQLSVSVDGETTQIANTAMSSAFDKRLIEYVVDFEQTDAGTEFQLKLDRHGDATLNTAFINLLDDTSFSSTPEANSELAMNEDVTIDWQEDKGRSYRLRLRLRCFSGFSSTTFLPINSTRNIETPFTFSLDQVFTLPQEHNFNTCELHSILNTAAFEDLSSSANFASVVAKVARQQHMVHSITFN